MGVFTKPLIQFNVFTKNLKRKRVKGWGTVTNIWRSISNKILNRGLSLTLYYTTQLVGGVLRLRQNTH